MVLCADGIPFRMIVPEPRTFALHKLWVSRQDSRNPLKSVKDAARARIVAKLAQRHLRLPLSAKEMPWLPTTLRRLIPDLKKIARTADDST